MKQVLIKLLKKIGKATQHQHNKFSEWVWNVCFDAYVKLNK